ncbi:hypothetical protein ISN44_As08g002110 [Arabidopsis suecica]|uniref:Uncharacterized protein n=1 Tax=Arabidopsis suecica TaxID=45249 RepID=A0A8T2B2I5_ARASU|nr:hypothetical protein ISN44_As08g002110 [Arabidopsis suecica]
MPPNMRSVMRSMGARRNFCSSVGSKSSLETRLVRPPFGLTSLIFGCCIYSCWDLANFYPKWKRNKEEDKLMKERHHKVVLEACRRRDNKLNTE